MVIALDDLGLHASEECPIDVYFRGRPVGKYRADLIVEDLVVLELECGRDIDAAHVSKLLHYLRSTDKEVGFVMNFGPRATFKRLAFDNSRKVSPGSGSICAVLRPLPRPSAAPLPWIGQPVRIDDRLEPIPLSRSGACDAVVQPREVDPVGDEVVDLELTRRDELERLARLARAT